MNTIIIIVSVIAFTQATTHALDLNKSTEEPFDDSQFNCITIEDCNFNGNCALNGTFCACNRDFATFEPGDGPHCNYERKRGITALLLHIFLGNGIAHFYVGRSGEGSALFLFVGWGFSVIIGCLWLSSLCLVNTKLTVKQIREIQDIGLISTEIAWLIIGLAIWIWLIALIANNNLTDNNGVALTSV